MSQRQPSARGGGGRHHRSSWPFWETVRMVRPRAQSDGQTQQSIPVATGAMPRALSPSANSLQLKTLSSFFDLESPGRVRESRNCSGAGMDPGPAGAMADACHRERTVDVAGRNLTPPGVEESGWWRRRRLICAIIELERYGMPRFHFDPACGDRSYHDPDGVELESIDDARQQLLGLLRDLTLHDDSGAADKTVFARVICEGDVVLQGSCSFSIHPPAAWSAKL